MLLVNYCEIKAAANPPHSLALSETAHYIKLQHHYAAFKKSPTNSLNYSMIFDDLRFITDFLNEATRIKNYFTMVSLPRLEATVALTIAALALPHGDIVETGVNAGGTFSLMAKLLLQHDSSSRKIYGFDSFEGLPPADLLDGDGKFGIAGKSGQMAVSYDKTKQNLIDWGCWNESRSILYKGYFNETLPTAPVQKISFLRLDGDMYVSTRDALANLYRKVVPGGYIYVDDYASFAGCKAAVDEFRTQHGIYEPMYAIRENNDETRILFEALWWRKRFN